MDAVPLSGCSATAAAPAPAAAGPTALIVHLDLNKTVLMTDVAAGAGDARSLLSSVLAAAAWGRVAGGAWALAEPLLRARRPRPPARRGAPLLSYAAFVKEVAHPFERAAAGAPPEARAAAAARNAARKRAQQALLAAFAAPGAPGACFAPALEALLARLAVPPAAAAACAASGLAGLRDGARFLLPAYFRLLRYLRHEQPLPFVVVLRTFGSDLEAAAAEHNAWAAGAHPLVAAAAGDGALAIDVAALAAIARSGADASVVCLREGGGDPVTGVRGIYESLLAQLPPPPGDGATPGCPAPGAVCGWRDDWPCWFRFNERAFAGKLMPVHPDETCLQVFLDDNIGDERHTRALLAREHVVGLPVADDDGHSESSSGGGDGDDDGGDGEDEDEDTDAGIVDVRCVVSGAPLSFARTQGTLLTRVCPISALLNEDYFVQALQRSQQRWVAARNKPQGLGSVGEELKH